MITPTPPIASTTGQIPPANLTTSTAAQTVFLKTELFKPVNFNFDQINLENLSQAEYHAFLEHLNCSPFDKSLKYLILSTVANCNIVSEQSSQLAQLLTLVSHLKSVAGVRLIQILFSANVPENERKIEHYLSILTLLIQLHEQPSLAKTVKETLPSLVLLIDKLTEMNQALIEAKHPQRDIDQTISYFQTKTDTVQFPLANSELDQIKQEYIAVNAYIQEYKKSPPHNTAGEIRKYATDFAANRTPESKYRMLAIIAETIRHHYKIAPYDTQILTVIALINYPEKMNGRIGQIKTGEGKSTIVPMLTAFMASQNKFVDICTPNRYLATRDQKKYAPFYATLGITSSHICEKNPKQSHFNGQIIYGTNTDFEFAFLRDGLNNAQLRFSTLGSTLQPRRFDVIIIDEVDNLFLDTALNSALLSVPGTEDYSWIYRPILDFVQNHPQNITPQLLRIHLLAALPEQKEKINDLSEQRLLKWINSAKIALKEKLENRDYVVKPVKKPNGQLKTEVVIVDYQNTGQLNEGSQWKDGIHQFLQAKHSLTINPESLTAASLAHPTYFSHYKTIFGVTGTMGELVERQEIQTIYSVDSFDVPPHLPSLRQPPIRNILPNANEQSIQILANILEVKKQGRPVLVLFSSIQESNAFSQTLQQQGIKHQLLNETQRENEDYLIARAGDPGMITIATNTAGRGTDILLAPQSKEAGGLHVIFTFYPSNIRVEAQGFGRAGRQGQPGTGAMILSADHESLPPIFVGNPELLSTPQFVDAAYQLLQEIRTNRIKSESKHREVSSQKEMIYFKKLKTYFDQTNTLYNILESPEFKEKFVKACKKLNQNQASLDPTWQTFGQMVRQYAQAAESGTEIDWTLTYMLFQEQYTNMIKRIWAEFYNQLHEQTEDSTIEATETRVETLFTKYQAKLEEYFDAPAILKKL